jgi:superfamily II DNA or RNA helicase
MDGALTPASADVVRARIAALVAHQATGSRQLGAIALQEHQRTAVARVRSAIREFGGALLADETGLGKTFVALSVAREAGRTVVVGPAALRDMWYQAARSADVDIIFVSAEALSRSAFLPIDDPDFVIVDECHHFRNPSTARYHSLAALTIFARVLLLSATPVHNSAEDLATLLSLFLGARASTLDRAWTSRCIIRRSADDVPAAKIPRVAPPEPLAIDHDERHLEALLALPPPIPPLDGGDGGSLLIYALIRQWASSRFALVEALRRRLARATALLAGLDAGRHPSAPELTAWSFADGTVQLAFPELVVDRDHATPAAPELAACVRAHADALRRLLNDLASTADPDVQRAARILALRERHPNARVVVFSQYADSVAGLFRQLREHPRVGALTADGGQVAGGTLTRAEVLARFAPRAQGVGAPRVAETIDLLLTTDLLSEGVNLQDASVAVHLDMPWTAARLDQRVGRIARIGSAHERVFVYAMLPPAGAEQIVRVEHRLREKLGVASRTVGVAGTIIPSLTLAAPERAIVAPSDGGEDTAGSPADLSEEVQTVLARWSETSDRSDDSLDNPPHRETGERNVAIFAAVAAPHSGFIAVLGDPSQPRLVADIGAGATDDPAAVVAALRAAGGDGTEAPAGAVSSAIESVGRWRARNRMQRDLSVDGALRARARRSVVDRISAITRRAPRHLRPAIAALAATARRTATGQFGAGAERVLGELAAASMPDEAWLRAVSTFGSIHGVGDELGRVRHPLLAVLLLVPRPTPDGSPSRGADLGTSARIRGSGQPTRPQNAE